MSAQCFLPVVSRQRSVAPRALAFFSYCRFSLFFFSLLLLVKNEEMTNRKSRFSAAVILYADCDDVLYIFYSPHVTPTVAVQHDP